MNLETINTMGGTMQFISDKAVLGVGVTIGAGVVIEDDVKIGDGTVIGHHVVIHCGSVIGKNVRVDDHASIGKQPMKAVTSATSDDTHQPPCVIGEGAIIGTGAVIYANAWIGERTLVADLSTIRENVKVGARTIIGRGVAIENHCTVGTRCKLETNVYLTAYSEVEDDCFVAPGVVTSNDNYAGRDKERHKHFKGVTIRRGGRIGAQATILPGKVIHEDGMVAAGSVVTRDVETKTVVVGNPAKELRKVPTTQLLDNQ